jgi:hypothetical protein
MRPSPRGTHLTAVTPCCGLGTEGHTDVPMAINGLTGQDGKRHGLAMHSATAPFLWIESFVRSAFNFVTTALLLCYVQTALFLFAVLLLDSIPLYVSVSIGKTTALYQNYMQHYIHLTFFWRPLHSHGIN